MSLNSSTFNGQGPVLDHDHVDNNHAASSYPQLQNCALTSYTFRDFMTPNEHATIPVIGTSKALESLDYTLSSPGVFARCSRKSHPFSAYTPLTIALNAICARVGLAPVTERDLAQLHRAPWFSDFSKAVVKRHNAEELAALNFNNLLSESFLNEDHMVLLAEAFAVANDLSNIELGVVTITKQGVKAFHYPWTATCDGLTAWIVADLRTDEPIYYGLGRDMVEQHDSIDEQPVGEEEERQDDEEEDVDEEDQEAPTTTPRKTAARVLAQQVPLPAGLSTKTILEKHTDNLQYNNILKVGLEYSNQEIARKVAEDAVRQNKKASTSSSGVVKRINTGIDFIEKEFEIDVGAFRTAYDTARKNNGIPIRGKDGVDDQILAANAPKINEAMAWVKAGGPHPANAVAPAPVRSGYAPASRNLKNIETPVRVRKTRNVPQLDGTMDEPDEHHDYALEDRADGFLAQYNNEEPDWDSMVEDTLLNFDDPFN
ncbi:hypothetical protein QM012_008218 [Aureobasidium pullulans]|uniref:Uncharacterized protein n=1 Tax=Aureobasidium pullulans TaxID=5580 RepID=A0ABR0TKF0_AURPU